MNQELVKQLKENIDDLIDSNRLTSAQIYLFGMNTPGDRVIQYLQSKGCFVEGIIDNNVNNQGHDLLGVRVYSPDILCGKADRSIRVLICSKYYPEMKLQLEKMGYQENVHIFKILELSPGTTISSEEKYFREAVLNLKKNMSVYHAITDAYEQEGSHYLLCPIRANGDIYISASLVQAFREKHKYKRVILIVVGKSGLKIADLFQLKDVLAVEQQEMEALVNLCRVLGSVATHMTVIHPEQYYFNIFSHLECFRLLNFMDFIEHGMLALEGDSFVNVPSSSKKEMHALLGEKDILLAPYANSLPCLPVVFWETLVEKLLEKGFHVYTNSDGEMEPAIKGTDPLFLAFDEIENELSHCGGFIGLRNGLCEIVSGFSCKKVVLYPEKGMGFGTVQEFYGLCSMGLCDEVLEIIYKEVELEKIVQQIMKYIEA